MCVRVTVCGCRLLQRKNTNVTVYPPVCCPAALISLHVKEQKCACNPSSIGSHLLTFEMADLKSDTRFE